MIESGFARFTETGFMIEKRSAFQKKTDKRHDWKTNLREQMKNLTFAKRFPAGASLDVSIQTVTFMEPRRYHNRY